MNFKIKEKFNFPKVQCMFIENLMFVLTVFCMYPVYT